MDLSHCFSGKPDFHLLSIYRSVGVILLALFSGMALYVLENILPITSTTAVSAWSWARSGCCGCFHDSCRNPKAEHQICNFFSSSSFPILVAFLLLLFLFFSFDVPLLRLLIIAGHAATIRYGTTAAAFLL